LFLFVEKVPFPILGRELESAGNMAIALIPTTTFTAVFYLERITHLFINGLPLDICLDVIKYSLPFTVFRCLLLMFPIYNFVVYFTYDSDFGNAFRRFYPSGIKEPSPSNESNHNSPKIAPKSSQITLRKRLSIKSTVL
jgi:hypothetical protein